MSTVERRLSELLLSRFLLSGLYFKQMYQITYIILKKHVVPSMYIPIPLETY